MQELVTTAAAEVKSEAERISSSACKVFATMLRKDDCVPFFPTFIISNVMLVA